MSSRVVLESMGYNDDRYVCDLSRNPVKFITKHKKADEHSYGGYTTNHIHMNSDGTCKCWWYNIIDFTKSVDENYEILVRDFGFGGAKKTLMNIMNYMPQQWPDYYKKNIEKNSKKQAKCKKDDDKKKLFDADVFAHRLSIIIRDHYKYRRNSISTTSEITKMTNGILIVKFQENSIHCNVNDNGVLGNEVYTIKLKNCGYNTIHKYVSDMLIYFGLIYNDVIGKIVDKKTIMNLVDEIKFIQ